MPAPQPPTEAIISSAKQPSPAPSADVAAKPPVATKRAHINTYHGEAFADPCRWLGDKKSAAEIAHLQTENAWTSA
jgi:hypothetical protein